MRLVFGIHVAAERPLRLVEYDREMGWLLRGLHFAQELPKHVAEAEHRIDLQPVGLAGQGRQRMIGAKDVGGTVNKVDVVALFWRACLDRLGSRFGLGGLVLAWPRLNTWLANSPPERGVVLRNSCAGSPQVGRVRLAHFNPHLRQTRGGRLVPLAQRSARCTSAVNLKFLSFGIASSYRKFKFKTALA